MLGDLKKNIKNKNYLNLKKFSKSNSQQPDYDLMQKNDVNPGNQKEDKKISNLKEITLNIKREKNSVSKAQLVELGKVLIEFTRPEIAQLLTVPQKFYDRNYER